MCTIRVHKIKKQKQKKPCAQVVLDSVKVCYVVITPDTHRCEGENAWHWIHYITRFLLSRGGDKKVVSFIIM